MISIIQLIKDSIQLYREHFVTIIKYLLLTAIPGALFLALIGPVAFLGPIFFASLLANKIFLIIISVLFLALLVIAIYLAIWFNLSLIKTIARLYQKETLPSVKTTLIETRPLIGRGFKSSLLVAILVMFPLLISGILISLASYLGGGVITTFTRLFGFVVMIYGLVHVVFFSVRFLFAAYEVAINKAEAVASLKNSSAIVKGQWGKIFLRLIVISLIIYVAIILLTLILQLINQIVNVAGVAIITNVILQICSFFLSAFTICGVTIL